jgi:ribosomal protein S18 acetylase RimI-like enzyme
MLNVRRFHRHEWRLYRELRLSALRDAPDAFGSTVAREERFVDDEWIQRLERGVASATELPLVAEYDGGAVGLCWVRLDPGDSSIALLYQVWVHPDARRRGVARGLLETGMQWAREAGARTMALSVSVVGESAVRLYEQAGFAKVGLPTPLRPGTALLQQAMESDLRAASDLCRSPR